MIKQAMKEYICFNTQPPEGGWSRPTATETIRSCFNTQPPEGGWISYNYRFISFSVSTHSRPKAAGDFWFRPTEVPKVSTHSRPKAAGFSTCKPLGQARCFNTQPPEGGWPHFHTGTATICRFNTQPPEGGWVPARHTARCRGRFNTQPPEGGWERMDRPSQTQHMFQHTAARRRLAPKSYAVSAV